MTENLRRLCAAVMLQIADEGSIGGFNDVMAQYIASSIVCAEPSNSSETLEPIVDILSRARTLLDNREQIWDELLPGPIRNEPEWDLLMEEIRELATNGAKLPRADNWDITVVIVNTDDMDDGWLVADDHGQTYFFNEVAYKNVSNPDGDSVEVGNRIAVYTDDLKKLDGSEIEFMLN